MADAEALIRKHRKRGLLVDANLLVLLLVGAVNQQRILTFKRTQDFTIEDFHLLTRLILLFGKLIATPHVLSQASDLTDLRGRELREIRQKFKLVVDQLEESYTPSRELVTDPLFERLGLADTAIAKVCSKGILVLTTDLQLHLAMERRGADALNFNHVRQEAWNWLTPTG
jgi:hypothetical protein